MKCKATYITKDASLPAMLNSSQQQKKSAYVIILTTPGSKWPINEFAGRSSGGDRATKFISLTTCAAQPILKQYHFA